MTNADHIDRVEASAIADRIMARTVVVTEDAAWLRGLLYSAALEAMPNARIRAEGPKMPDPLTAANKQLREDLEGLRAAVIRISRTPVYEEPRKKESGISVAISSAIMDAVLLANGGKMPPLEREPRGDDVMHTGFCRVLIGPCPCPRRDGKPRA